MPFDGNFPTESSMAELDVKIRQLTIDAERRHAREFYAKAKLPRKFVPLPAILPRRAMKARESIVVLDLLERFFDYGESWCQNTFHDGRGNRCIVGALRHIRSIRGAGDHAGVYLSRAISIACAGGGTLIEFNDSCASYAEIRAAISFARTLAQQVVDSYAGQPELAFSAPF
jgi:hypothetical protein